jgi:glycosyltransferase involved in cell wall biosynthesis
MLDHHGHPPDRVSVVPPGWDGTPLPAVPHDHPTIVCVARLRREKGHEVLLDALVLVRREVPDVRLLLVGGGPMRSTLEARASALGLGASVEITGDVRDVWPYLASADVFALASPSEPFGIATVEALAAGLPVVAPDGGGTPELVKPGVTGLLFPPGDVGALAAQLVRLLRDPILRRAMAPAGRELAASLRVDHTVARYLELYERLLSAPAGHLPGE